MKMGLLTAPFPATELTAIADWAATNSFEILEACCWPSDSGETRRYGGISHIDVDDLSESRASEIVDDFADRGITLSGLGYYPNPLHPDADHRAADIAHLKKVITAAERMHVPVVNTFIGADASRTQAENWEDARKVWPERDVLSPYVH